VDDGDDLTRKRHSHPVDLLKYEERYATSSTTHTRSKKKLAHLRVRENIARRADVGVELMCVMLAVDQMQRGEFECWIGLKEGILFEPKPKRSRKPGRRWWKSVPPPAKSATVTDVARHYGYTERSVTEMDRRARKTLDLFRRAAGLLDNADVVQVWPAVNNQRNLMEHLFG